MKKIITLAMGIAFLAKSYGVNPAIFATPPRSQQHFQEFTSFTSASHISRAGIGNRNLPLSPLDWNISTLRRAAASLNTILEIFNPEDPLADPSSGNERIINGANQSFQKEKTNHLGIMQIFINDSPYTIPKIFLSGSDNKHIRVKLKGPGLESVDLSNYSETLGSAGYCCTSAQACAHTERTAMLWLINKIDDKTLPILPENNLLVQLKIAHKGVCPACSNFLRGYGCILENTNIMVGKSNKDSRKIEFNIWYYLPLNTQIQISNDNGELLLDIKRPCNEDYRL